MMCQPNWLCTGSDIWPTSQRERGSLELGNHLALAEEAEIAAALLAGGIDGLFHRLDLERLAAIELGLHRLGLVLGSDEDVARVDFLRPA